MKLFGAPAGTICRETYWNWEAGSTIDVDNRTYDPVKRRSATDS
jgi:hypothetical protein